MENSDRSRLLLPFLGPLYDALAPYAWPMLRITLGLWLFFHGFPKLFWDDAVPTSRNFVNFGWAYPLAWAYFIGVIETLGGALLAMGLGTRLVAAIFAIDLFVISFAVLYPNWGWGKRGMEYALMMAILSVALAIKGGGRLSIDRLLRKEI